MPIQRLKVTASTSVKAITEEDQREVEGMKLNWEQDLHFASTPFHISKDPKDYLLYPVPIIYSDIPNRNGVAFPLSELVKWNVQLGRQAYKGWAGMPMFTEHQSDNVETAVGMVIDVSLRRIKDFANGKFWKVLALAAIDRRKNPKLAERMEKGELNTYSMGAMVDYCSCSFCGKKVGECNHIPEGDDKVTFYENEGRLVFTRVHNVSPYELSVVEDPAYSLAISDKLITYR